jgi:hypothetical protein
VRAVPATAEGAEGGIATTSIAPIAPHPVPVPADTSQDLPDSGNPLAMSLSDRDDMMGFLEELLDESSQDSQFQRQVSSDFVPSMTPGGV